MLKVPEIPSLVTGALLGSVFLCAGIAIGLWLGRRLARLAVGALSPEQVQGVIGQLAQWTAGIESDVSRYRTILNRASQNFDPGKASHTDREVMHLLDEIVSANEELQGQLDSAESTLRTQANEIDAYMCEARTDTLTELPNRRAFDDELRRQLAEWHRDTVPLGMLLIDIDHFKGFNDQYGHQAGDFVLREVARTLRVTMRESHLVARFGGEEFAVVLPDMGVHGGCQAAERARRAIEGTQFNYEGRSLQVTVSCGATQAQSKESLSSLVKRADQALYASKAAGRNASHWHDGKRCVPLNPRREAHARSSIRSDHDFEQVCDDLRRKLLEVAEREQ